MIVPFNQMQVGQQVRFVRYTQDSAFKFTPGKVYTVVQEFEGALTVVAPRDDEEAVPREDWGFEFETV